MWSAETGVGTAGATALAAALEADGTVDPFGLMGIPPFPMDAHGEWPPANPHPRIR